MTFNHLMHPRNIYRNPPDFQKLASDYPEFGKIVVTNASGKISVDFKDPAQLRAVTQTLLKSDFNLDVVIPENFLIPTVPQRLNYILWIEDLIAKLPQREGTTKGVDIGTGPCCILSLLGAIKNSWTFVATELQDESITWAKQNIEKNNLQQKIKVVKAQEGCIFKEISFPENENFDFCVCNPPFFKDFNESQGRKKTPNQPKAKEIYMEGGEVFFVQQILQESLELKEKIRIYTSMLGKKSSVLEFENKLRTTKGLRYSITEFGQGNTIRWGIAWTFLPGVEFGQDTSKNVYKKKQPKKRRLPLTFKLEQSKDHSCTIDEVLNKIMTILGELQIKYSVICTTKSKACITLQAYVDTWTHQRRKRRQLQDGTINKQDVNQSNELLNSKNVKETTSETMSIESSGDKNYTYKDVPSATKELLLNCELSVTEAKSNRFLEMQCKADGFRENMNRVFCLLKNRLSA